MAAPKKRSASGKRGPSPKRSKKSGRRPQKQLSKQTKRFPIKKIHELLQQKFTTGIVKPEAAVFLTAILEYLAVEILEHTANVARSRSPTSSKGPLKLTMRDVLDAIQSDEEMKELIDKVRLGDLK